MEKGWDNQVNIPDQGWKDGVFLYCNPLVRAAFGLCYELLRETSVL